MNEITKPEPPSEPSIVPSAPRARAIVLHLSLLSIVQAAVRIWGHFTISGFLNDAAEGLVVSAVLLPIYFAIATMWEGDRERKGGA